MNPVPRWRRRVDALADRRPARFLLWMLGVNLVFVGVFDVAGRALPAGGPDVVDLQLSLTSGVFTQIVGLWGGAVDTVFWSTVLLDFLFPVAYAVLLRHVYTMVCRGALVDPKEWVGLAPVAAAASDWIENGCLLILLRLPLPPPGALVGAMSAAAILKFLLLTVTAAFIVAALVKGDAVRVLKIARYAVLSLVIGTLPLFTLDQGRDLLVSLSHESAAWHRIWFVVWLIVWAFSTWYWSRVLLDAEAARRTTPEFEAWSRWLPRWTGALTLLVPGAAILLEADQAVRAGVMWWLGGLCVGLGVAFLVFVITRRHPDTAGRTETEFAMTPAAVSPPRRAIVIGSLAVSFAMFAWMTIAPQSAGAVLGAVAILAIVAGNTVFFGSLVVFITEARRIPIELCALACAAVFSVWNDNHDVALHGDKPARPALAAAFAEWLAGAPRDAGGRVPVVIAAAEGGGIRAAYWTAAVLHRLDDEAELQFSRRLLAISSVSGSSFGAAVYAGLKKDAAGAANQGPAASRILQRPFLAPMVAKLVTGDFLQWFLPFPFRPFDRSTAMEEGFARAYMMEAPGRRNTMAVRLAELRGSRETQVPLLFFNSTSVQSGRRVVASMVEWLPPQLSADATDPIDFHDWLLADVTVSTAAHNTARFPYISPAGRLRARNGEYLGHLVDGGYFDNTGAETVLDVIDQLGRTVDLSGVRFVVIALANSLPATQMVMKDQVAWRKTAELGEVFSPFRALLQARDARGALAIDRLRARVGAASFIELRVCDDPGDDRTARAAPLGWQLSADMVAELERQFTQQCFASAVSRVAAALR